MNTDLSEWEIGDLPTIEFRFNKNQLNKLSHQKEANRSICFKTCS